MMRVCICSVFGILVQRGQNESVKIIYLTVSHYVYLQQLAFGTVNHRILLRQGMW
jgi:hypothetical protein